MVMDANIADVDDTDVTSVTSTSPVLPICSCKPMLTLAKQWESYGVIVGMLRDLFMMRRTSTSGRLSCLVWEHPSSAAAMCRSKRSDTDFFRSLGFPLKKEPSHCFITLSIFSVLVGKRLDAVAIKGEDDTWWSVDICVIRLCALKLFSEDCFLVVGLYPAYVLNSFSCDQEHLYNPDDQKVGILWKTNI